MPSRQKRQTPQVYPSQGIPTRSPIRWVVTLRPSEVDAADDFMAGNDGIFDAGKLGVDDVKVGPANPAGAHLDANFAVAGEGIRARPASGAAPPEPATPSHASASPQMPRTMNSICIGQGAGEPLTSIKCMAAR